MKNLAAVAVALTFFAGMTAGTATANAETKTLCVPGGMDAMMAAWGYRDIHWRPWRRAASCSGNGGGCVKLRGYIRGKACVTFTKEKGVWYTNTSDGRVVVSTGTWCAGRPLRDGRMSEEGNTVTLN